MTAGLGYDREWEKQRGETYEHELRAHLRLLGCNVEPFGCGRWHGTALIADLHRLRHPILKMPDLIATRGDAVWLIDAKWPHGTRALIPLAGLRVALFYRAVYGVPVVYVFRGMGAVDSRTCESASVDGEPTGWGSGDPYVVVDPAVLRPVPEVFA